MPLEQCSHRLQHSRKLKKNGKLKMNVEERRLRTREIRREDLGQEKSEEKTWDKRNQKRRLGTREIRRDDLRQEKSEEIT
jgi:hypothetical protein